jgi:hypothetical protein
MKHKIYLSILVLGFNAVAQTPTGPARGTFPPIAPNTSIPWLRGGNLVAGTGGFDNIFGTFFNSPIYTHTNGKNRMIVNGDKTTTINSYPGQVTDGFIGIGANTALQGFPWNGPAAGPFSLLHLNSGVGGFVQQFGWRPWMKYGITSTHNQDLMFFGQRATGGLDITDVVIGWADNSGAGSSGPDNMVFNFLAGSGPGTDDLTGTANNGREIMRLTGYGNIGVGPRFNNNWQPQSTYHQHQENSAASWMQITNQSSPLPGNVTTSVTGPTPITANDGLKWGINTANTGYLYNQENNHLLFSTNHTAGTNERMRITHIGAPGTPNPAGFFPFDISRVSISHNPSLPLTNPLALLHIGYNTGNPLGIPGFTTDGWRNWMDVGLLTTKSSDHAYFGLKQEPSVGVGASIDRQDAIIGWGDNYNSPVPGINTGPDKLRVIFTSPAAGAPFAGPGAMSSQNGLEFVRYVPYHNTSLNTNDPRIGFGDFNSLLPVGTIDPANTVEINSILNGALSPANTSVAGSYVGSTGASGLRLRDLTSGSSVVPSGNPAIDVTKVLSVDNLGNVVLINGGSTGLGNLCGATSNSLTNSYEIPMAGFNFNYTMPALSTSQVHIGQTACAINPARLHVVNDNLTTAGVFNSKANNLLVLYGSYSKSENTGLGDATGVFGEAVCVNPANNTAIGVHGVATSTASRVNIGIYGTGKDGFAQTYGGYFQALGSTSFGNSGIYAIASTVNPSATTYGVSALANGFGNANYGGYFSAAGTGLNTGIYADCTTSPTNWAGFFNEKVFINGAGISSAGLIFSDQNIKSNVATVSNPLDLLLRLRPVSYNLNNAYAPQLNVDTAKTFGLIAQEVAILIPELVKDVIVPPIYDSIGSITTPSVAIKSLNYNGLIPLTISAIQAINSSQNVMQTQLNKAGLSDALVKTNINNFNALAKIKTLNPVSYNFTNVSVPQLTFTPQVDYGFVAQQLQLVYPELVDTLRIPAKYDSLGVIVNIAKVLKTVNYKAMSALLTRAVQEQQFKIDSLLLVASKQDSINNAVQTQIANLTSMINACCSNPGAKTSNPSINQLDVELSDKDAIILNQNVPNPFAEQTTITYNVPASVTKAQLLFFNANGQLIQTVDIKTRGKGKVNVFASDLSSGLYHYTLVADGKVVDSKKMVRE